MTIRLLTADDAQAYTGLRREMLADAPWAFTSSVDDDRALQPGFVPSLSLDSGHVIAGGFQDSRLVASAGIRRNTSKKMAHRAHVWGVYVTPSARGAGWGARVMRGAIDAAAHWKGVDSVSLSASVRSLAAIRLYERLGFVRWGVEPGAVVLNGQPIDEIHMLLRLTSPTSTASGATASSRA
jgi:RimJ/RimL family protein N-acetyltransferase